MKFISFATFVAIIAATVACAAGTISSKSKDKNVSSTGKTHQSSTEKVKVTTPQNIAKSVKELIKNEFPIPLNTKSKVIKQSSDSKLKYIFGGLGALSLILALVVLTREEAKIEL